MSHAVSNVCKSLQGHLLYSLVFFIFLCNGQAGLADELPGAATFTTELESKLKSARLAMGNDYQPRTEHLNKDGSPRYTNRLILEDSPYLLQHAHNPVNWYAWGKAAFAEARRQNKPVFLSIGYSTCHWCHVMEKESFESIEVARYLNQHFIAIKVDRERRPHVDELYMTALLLLKGQGGWPMSSFLLADGKSFYGGTYYPRDEFLNLLMEIVAAWTKDKDKLEKYAVEIARSVKEEMKLQQDSGKVTEQLVQTGISQLMSSYDQQWGGFGYARKFPNEASLMLLLQYGYRNRDNEILNAVDHSLMMMGYGGIYDQLAGGFHRYATDPYWLVPHFEKMLYNQANLSRLYAMAYKLNGNYYFKRIAEQTIDYVLAEMKSADGVFYSASDADSEGGEGSYYVWSLDEISNILSAKDTQFIKTVYGMTKEGNFAGKNILYLPHSYTDIAELMHMGKPAFLDRLDNIRRLLLAERQKRSPPLRDDKIIVAWNSMMITAMAETGVTLQQPHYIMAAVTAAKFLWIHQRQQDGSLLRVSYKGKSSVVANQEDYAFFAEALIALYDATNDQFWLQRAEKIVTQMISRFADKHSGGFYMNEDRQSLYVAPMQIRDSALPSGNAVAIRVLIDMARRTRERKYEILARKTLQAFAASMQLNTMAYPSALGALDNLIKGETGAVEYSKTGVVKATAKILSKGKNIDAVSISLQIAAGWHINSSSPVQDNLVPLRVKLSESETAWRWGRQIFPDPIFKTLSFENKKLSLYEGDVRIDTEVDKLPGHENARRLDILIALQACNDEMCLLPEVLPLELITPKNDQMN